GGCVLAGVEVMPEEYRRIQANLMNAPGMSYKEIADTHATSQRSVKRWGKAYLHGRRVIDLFEEYLGRHIKAEIITAPKILKEIHKNPMNLGYMTTVWTVPLLATHLSKKYKTPITPRTLRRRMKEAGLTWKRPRYVYHQRAE